MRIFKRTTAPSATPNTSIDPVLLAGAAPHAAITASGRVLACTR